MEKEELSLLNGVTGASGVKVKRQPQPSSTCHVTKKHQESSQAEPTRPTLSFPQSPRTTSQSSQIVKITTSGVFRADTVQSCFSHWSLNKYLRTLSGREATSGEAKKAAAVTPWVW